MPQRIDEETVAELRDAVRDLLRDEDARAQSLTARATAVAGFVGVIVAVVATVWPAVEVEPSSRLGAALAATAGGAVTSLVAAMLAVIVRVLLPSPGVRLASSEVERFRTLEVASQPPVVIRGDLLATYARALIDESERNRDRARWLTIGYVLVAAGLVLTAAAGTIATIDAYYE